MVVLEVETRTVPRKTFGSRYEEAQDTCGPRPYRKQNKEDRFGEESPFTLWTVSLEDRT